MAILKSVSVLPLRENKSASKENVVIRLVQDYVVIKEVCLSLSLDERSERNHNPGRSDIASRENLQKFWYKLVRAWRMTNYWLTVRALIKRQVRSQNT